MFYMNRPGREARLDGGDLKMIHATRYCSTGSAGYVYIPGPGESLPKLNSGTIMRGDAERKWPPPDPSAGTPG
jgi:hypothetical protein